MEAFEQKRLRALWAMVLTVAIQDALAGITKARRSIHSASAELWIFDPENTTVSNSFDNVCGFLDFDPDRVRGIVRQMGERVKNGARVRDVLSGLPGRKHA